MGAWALLGWGVAGLVNAAAVIWLLRPPPWMAVLIGGLYVVIAWAAGVRVTGWRANCAGGSLNAMSSDYYGGQAGEIAGRHATLATLQGQRVKVTLQPGVTVTGILLAYNAETGVVTVENDSGLWVFAGCEVEPVT